MAHQLRAAGRLHVGTKTRLAQMFFWQHRTSEKHDPMDPFQIVRNCRV